MPGKKLKGGGVIYSRLTGGELASFYARNKDETIALPYRKLMPSSVTTRQYPLPERPEGQAQEPPVESPVAPDSPRD